MWTLWISVVTLTDLSDFMVALKLLPSTFPAVSGNLGLVFVFLKRYHLDMIPVAYTVYTAIILWAAMIAAAYWVAFISFFSNRTHYVYYTTLAFMLNAGMVGFFLVLDEIFIQYEAGHTHMLRLMAILISFLAFCCLNLDRIIHKDML